MIFEDKFYEDEIRNDFLIPSKMKHTWAAEMEVLEEIQRICELEHITYYADWGTLLGAVRHNGMIPWDDDIDIGMRREDYMRFLESAPKLLGPEFEVKSLYNDPEHDNVKARVISGRYMNFDKKYLERFHDCPYVVGIDIFPLDYIPRDSKKSQQQTELIELVLTLAGSIPQEPPYTHEVWELVEKIEKMTNLQVNRENRLFHELKKIVDILSAQYGSDESDELTSMIDLAGGWDYHAKKEWYDEVIMMPFETMQMPVPIGYDGILRIKYGDDYMTPRNAGSSHDYPFYKQQEQGLKAVMEKEFHMKISDEEMEQLIQENIAQAKRGPAQQQISKIKLGIIGTGRIVQRFIPESKSVSHLEVVAIYNPNLSSALHLADQMGLEEQIHLTDNMEEFLALVDAVYIAAPHEYHFEYAKQMLSVGKHVICEKPMAFKGDDAFELFSMAQQRKLICMEAVKTAYCPGFLGLIDLVHQGVIGRVYDVEACFTKIGASAGRELWSKYGGSFVELGSYNLLPISQFLGINSEESYIWSLDSANKVDSYTKMVISYSRGTATAKTGLGVKSEGELIMAGEKGYIRIPSPWWITTRIEVHHENPNQVEVYEFPYEGCGLRYEFTSFVKKIMALQKKCTQGFDSEESYIGAWNEIMECEGVTPQQSMWFADQMELFLNAQDSKWCANKIADNVEVVGEKGIPKIWAHRGCSMKYPENTLLSFKKAAEVSGITGVELDVQLTRDGEMVVIHDEKVDRTTTGNGYVRDYTLEELKQLYITPSGHSLPYISEDGGMLTIPTLEEVFLLLLPYCKQNHFMINIELKNSVIRYEGMEQKVLKLVEKYDLQENIVYSSFLHESMGLIKELNSKAKTGILAGDIYQCLEGMERYHADALHPWNIGMGINVDFVEELQARNLVVRMWNGDEPLYGSRKICRKFDLDKYVQLGATDIITNIPEMYCETL